MSADREEEQIDERTRDMAGGGRDMERGIEELESDIEEAKRKAANRQVMPDDQAFTGDWEGKARTDQDPSGVDLDDEDDSGS